MGTPKQLPSDESVIPNLVITIHMKKMDSSSNSGAGSPAWDYNNHHHSSTSSSSDSNNNDGSNSNHSVKATKSESACKGLYKLIFSKSTSHNDSNNNQSSTGPSTGNSYTKVSMSIERPSIESSMSQLTINQNRQMINQLAQHGNSIAMSQMDSNKRWVLSN